MDASILEASSKRTSPESFHPSYGTAGFRAKAHLLSSTVFRCGLLMGLRSLKTNKTTGICITASHNPAPDNGVKLVEPTGEMLLQEYESLADELANAETDEKLLEVLKRIMAQENISTDQENAQVLVAYDTRPSGLTLASDAIEGIECLGIPVKNLGVMTTPQLHWAVMRTNRGLDSSEEAYYNLLSESFRKLVGTEMEKTLHVDCANGVGGIQLRKLSDLLKSSGLNLVLHNTGDGVLNHLCGSDFIQKERTLPDSMGGLLAEDFACSIDGDADRLVYFYRDSGNPDSIVLLDGDKIAALVATLLKNLVTKLPGDLSKSTIGVVQTAYANGSSTKYLTDKINCEVVVTPTGVKHLHKAAHEFDVGIYFEANGHGTVLFKKSFIKSLKDIVNESKPAEELLSINMVINEAVGDAISDILLVETALKKQGMNLCEWASLYEDLPSRQLKAEIKDRSVIRTTDAERRVAEPQNLQQRIDDLVVRYPGARSFVRPSGTEDIVRIYAEATSSADADELAEVVRQTVIDMLG